MKKWIKIVLWILFFGAISTGFYFVNSYLSVQPIENIDILVSSDDENAFLNKSEVEEFLKSKRLIFEGQKVEELNTEKIEAVLKTFSQIKSVEVFKPIGNQLKINIHLRKPIVHVYNKFDEDFYLDDEGMIVQRPNQHSARLLVASGQIYDRKNGRSVDSIIHNDSLKTISKLDEIYRISNYVCHNPELRSLISQMYFENDGTVVLTPVVGGFRIVFGTAKNEEEVARKFDKLSVFYREGLPNTGWNTYREVDLRFEGQIIGRKKNS